MAPVHRAKRFHPYPAVGDGGQKSKSRLKDLFRSLNRYVFLNPNIFDAGINLSKIIEDIDRKHET